jgi:hypothetical protein
METIEIWRDIPGLPGYQASSLGRIRSVDTVREYIGRWGLTRRQHHGRILALWPHQTGYRTVLIGARGSTHHYVQRLVAETFIGPIPSRMQVIHLNGVRDDNRACNLQIGTRQDLMNNAKAIGLIKRDLTARPRAMRVYRERNPEKYASRQAYRNALKSGALARLPCEICGNPKSHGHHDDYSKPLDVRWLCHTHHVAEHGGRYRPLLEKTTGATSSR